MKRDNLLIVADSVRSADLLYAVRAWGVKNKLLSNGGQPHHQFTYSLLQYFRF